MDCYGPGTVTVQVPNMKMARTTRKAKDTVSLWV